MNMKASSSFAHASAGVIVIWYCGVTGSAVNTIGVNDPVSKIVGPSLTALTPPWILLTFDLQYILIPLNWIVSPTAFITGTFVAYTFHASRCAWVNVWPQAVTSAVIAERTDCCAAVPGFTGMDLARKYIPPRLWLATSPPVDPLAWVINADLNFIFVRLSVRTRRREAFLTAR
jgi:hypothetical protein